MPDLAAWLLEQIDTDRESAYWTHYYDCEFEMYGCNCGIPKRLEAECDAKRRIITDRIQDHQVTMYGRGVVYEQHRVLRSLAAVYADRPGYDPAWAPSGTMTP